MKKPTSYKVPTLIENSKDNEAMQEWRELIDYVNYLESKLKDKP